MLYQNTTSQTDAYASVYTDVCVCVVLFVPSFVCFAFLRRRKGGKGGTRCGGAETPSRNDGLYDTHLKRNGKMVIEDKFVKNVFRRCIKAARLIVEEKERKEKKETKREHEKRKRAGRIKSEKKRG